MKKIIIYNSSTGFTKRYAEWIAEDLKCEAVSLKKINVKELSSYDTVIFGGWIMGSMIMGLDKIRKNYSGKLVLFASGSTPYSEEVITTIKNQNHLDDTPFFYMQSGFNFEKIGFVKKMMLNMVRKSVVKKENKTEQDMFMLNALQNSSDYTDRKFIEPLVNYMREA